MLFGLNSSLALGLHPLSFLFSMRSYWFSTFQATAGELGEGGRWCAIPCRHHRWWSLHRKPKQVLQWNLPLCCSQFVGGVLWWLHPLRLWYDRHFHATVSLCIRSLFLFFFFYTFLLPPQTHTLHLLHLWSLPLTQFMSEIFQSYTSLTHHPFKPLTDHTFHLSSLFMHGAGSPSTLCSQ